MQEFVTKVLQSHKVVLLRVTLMLLDPQANCTTYLNSYKNGFIETLLDSGKNLFGSSAGVTVGSRVC